MGRKAKGTLLQIGDGAGPEVFTSVAELTSIGAPSFGTGSIDTTNYDSTAEEFISDGIQIHGDVAIEGNWLPEHASQNETAGLLSKAIAGGAMNVQLVVSAGTTTKTFKFPVILTFQPQIGGPKDALKFSATLKVAGPVTTTSA